MNIIIERELVADKEYYHCFETSTSGNGYAFDCTETGELINDENSQYLANRYALALSGQLDGRRVYDAGLEYRMNSYIQPAIGICEVCDRRVVLESFTNPCSCGADYNMSGSLLSPRDQWGEETGEHWSECI